MQLATKSSQFARPRAGTCRLWLPIVNPIVPVLVDASKKFNKCKDLKEKKTKD